MAWFLNWNHLCRKLANKEKFNTDLAEYNADGSYELPLPGTFVIAPDGIIKFVFVEVDYTRRMEPEEILEQLRKLG